MLTDVSQRDQGKELKQFHVEAPAYSSTPAVLGIRLMELILGNIPLSLVPDLKQGPNR